MFGEFGDTGIDGWTGNNDLIRGNLFAKTLSGVEKLVFGLKIEDCKGDGRIVRLFHCWIVGETLG